jgi:hypothetical protein
MQTEQFNRRFEEEVRQFGLSFGLQSDEVKLRATQIENDERLRGREISVAEARQRAEEELGGKKFEEEKRQFDDNMRRMQLIDLAEQTGFVHEFDEEGRIVRTNRPINANEQQRLNRELQTGLQKSELAFRERAELNAQVIRQSEASGIMHRIDADGNIVPVTGPDGTPVATSAERLETARQALAASEGNADRASRERIQNSANDVNREIAMLRQQIDLSQQTGTIWEMGPDGQLINTGRATARQDLEERALKLNELIGKSGLTGFVFDPETGRYTQQPTAAARESQMERDLRKLLGLTDVVGYVYNPDTNSFDKSEKTVGRSAAEAQARLAENQMMIQLAQMLSTLSMQDLKKFLEGLGQGGGTDSGTTPGTTETQTGTGGVPDPGDTLTNPPTITSGSGNPDTWGNIDPETGQAWQSGRILVASNGSPWIFTGGRWQPYTQL